MLASIPSPSSNGFHVGPLFFHFYGLCYVVGITAAVLLTRRLWREKGGDPDLVYTVAMWGVPAGILGGRLYHDVTSWGDLSPQLVGVAGDLAGRPRYLGGHSRRLHRRCDTAAPPRGEHRPVHGHSRPGPLGRPGDRTGRQLLNQELFGGPTSLPWGLQISPGHRPVGYLAYSTFQPTFLYELIWDLALAATLLWLVRHKQIRAPGIFALYVTGYSAFRIFEELLRVDPAHHILGERLNFWVASLLTIVGFVWFVYIQRADRGADTPREPLVENVEHAPP